MTIKAKAKENGRVAHVVLHFAEEGWILFQTLKLVVFMPLTPHNFAHPPCCY
jgi:hypothetical protein